MVYSKTKIEELMNQYLQETEDFGDSFEELELINEVFSGFKPLLIESTSDRISESLLQEHALSLKGIPKDIFEDFVLYLQMTELDSRLL
jgi:hypothetical protein